MKPRKLRLRPAEPRRVATGRGMVSNGDLQARATTTGPATNDGAGLTPRDASKGCLISGGSLQLEQAAGQEAVRPLFCSSLPIVAAGLASL